jgi:hypothetical protein
MEDVKPVLEKFVFSKKKNGFQPTTIWRRRIFNRMNCGIGGFHPVLGFRFIVCCGLVTVW